MAETAGHIQILTIGHSSHALGTFLWLLQQHQIRALVDVRRYPDYRHCHRRLLSDHLVANGVTVQHIFSSGEATPHKMSARAKIVDGAVTYPDQPTLFDM